MSSAGGELACQCTVRRLMATGLLRVALQPILDLQDGTALAYEALVRCSDPAWRGPRLMFEEAVENGCCGALGRAIRELAVNAAPDLPLFLNVHPSELTEPWLLAADDPIYRHGPPVYLEITESVPLSQLAESRVLLHRLRHRGIHVVVDDLGAGYSNLRYIAELNPRLVKLDRALVSGLRPGSRMHRLVAGLTVLCASLDAQVVAEGIETLAELHAVREAGVAFGQGYLFARPDFPAPQHRWPLADGKRQTVDPAGPAGSPASHVRSKKQSGTVVVDGADDGLPPARSGCA